MFGLFSMPIQRAIVCMDVFQHEWSDSRYYYRTVNSRLGRDKQSLNSTSGASYAYAGEYFQNQREERNQKMRQQKCL